MDAALLARYERAVRPAALQWDDWANGQLGKIHRALAALDAQADHLQGPLDIGQIGVGCALGYLDFRFADLPWRTEHAGLTAFFGRIGERESFRTSRPDL
ncbi:hypothetical protein FQZ97_1259680 [compost metagenome]